MAPDRSGVIIGWYRVVMRRNHNGMQIEKRMSENRVFCCYVVRYGRIEDRIKRMSKASDQGDTDQQWMTAYRRIRCVVEQITFNNRINIYAHTYTQTDTQTYINDTENPAHESRLTVCYLAKETRFLFNQVGQS